MQGGAPASASVTASGAGARTAGAPESASITAAGVNARTAGVPASASITTSGANVRTTGAPASASITASGYAPTRAHTYIHVYTLSYTWRRGRGWKKGPRSGASVTHTHLVPFNSTHYGTQRTVPWGRCPGCWCGGLHHQRTQTLAGCRLGGYPTGRDRWGGKRAAGGMSEDHDRCFSMLVLGGFSTGVFQSPMHYPALTLAPTCRANRTS
jgi:hypothetical protein